MAKQNQFSLRNKTINHICQFRSTTKRHRFPTATGRERADGAELRRRDRTSKPLLAGAAVAAAASQDDRRFVQQRRRNVGLLPLVRRSGPLPGFAEHPAKPERMLSRKNSLSGEDNDGHSFRRQT